MSNSNYGINTKMRTGVASQYRLDREIGFDSRQEKTFFSSPRHPDPLWVSPSLTSNE
jgi:hypothetical protein